MCLPNTKIFFSHNRKMIFSLWLKWLRFNCFWECRFWRYQRWQFENNNFSKKICYGSFRYLSALRKKEHHLSTFFFMGQITQISLFSGILLLERSKITVREQHFFKKKKIIMEVLGLHLPYIKRYFRSTS